jgi:hypothetical protein
VQNAARQPFADGQTLTPGSRSGGLSRFRRNTRNIPGEFCPHFESLVSRTRYRKYRGQDIV